MVTLEGAELALASLTTSEKVRLAAGRPGAMEGAVKAGFAAAASESVTGVPEAWVQEKRRGRPAGSLLALPSSVTSAPDATLWSGPALATGGGTMAFTVMVTVSGADAPLASLTTSEKTSEAGGVRKATAGAVKPGWAGAARGRGVAGAEWGRVAPGPTACDQENVSDAVEGTGLALLPWSVTSAPEVTF